MTWCYTYYSKSLVARLTHAIEVKCYDIKGVVLSCSEALDEEALRERVERAIVDKHWVTCSLLNHVESVTCDVNIAWNTLIPLDEERVDSA